MPRDANHRRVHPAGGTPSFETAPADTAAAPPLAVLLREGFRWFTDRLNETAASSGEPRLSAAAAIVVSYVRPDGSRPVEIARAMGVSRQHIHSTVRELADAGIVTTVADPTSRRDRLVVPTPDGAKRQRRAVVQLQQLEAELSQRLDPGEFDRLREVLVRLWSPSTGSEATPSEDR